MKATSIDTHWLTARTGDPFADAGGMAIDFLMHLPALKGKSILEIIDYATDIYVNSWDGKLHPFFLNSTITQPQFIGDRKRQETLAYFASIIEEDCAFIQGHCEITGRKTRLFSAGRNNQLLAGSGTFVNFHCNLQPGTFLSKEVLIRMFFVPLAVHRLADKIALVTSNNEKILQFFVFQNCIRNLDALKDKTSSGPLKSNFKNPANAVFRFVDEYLEHLANTLNAEEAKNFDPAGTHIEMYHFSNLGQKPEVVKYDLDSDVFQFYAFCQSNYKTEWQSFVQRQYNPENYAKSVFNEEEQKWQTKEGEEITFAEYQRWRNFALIALFNKAPLSKILLRWSIYNPFPMEIITEYHTKIRGMQNNIVLKVEAIAEFIAGTDEEKVEEFISDFNSSMSRAELRKVFLKIQTLAYRSNAESAMLSAEDYLDALLPKQTSWTEVRDLFVISIYQKRHLKASQ